MSSQKRVIIIGSGVSGMAMAVQLQRLLGHQNFTIFEKADNIGGTWWHNRYPACACDIPSHFYSYSFALKPDWSTTYPGRDELHDYFLSVAEKYDLVRRCKFNEMCLKAEWDDARSMWSVTFQNTLTGKVSVHEAAVVVSAVGTLDRPAIPAIPGRENFKGVAFHSARWNPSVQMKGKRVVVLGNGASATQFVPKLVEQVGSQGQVTQLVKSAHWWTKRGNPKYPESFKWTMAYVPFAARIYRIFLAWELESFFYSFLMTPSGAAMREKIRNDTYKFIETEAPKEYQEILKPDYEPGCKRRVNTLDYLRTLHSPNMLLAKDRPARITATEVITESGEIYPADVLIYATGFLTQRWLFPIEVKGREGKDLSKIWDKAGGAEAYKGTVVADFPNFFVLYGPNAATGQHSVIFHSECQINYSCRLLRPILREGVDSIAVKPQAQKRDLEWVHGRLGGLVFNSGCQSWWMDPITKKNTFIYPDPMFKYWLRTIFPVWTDFDLIKASRKVNRSHPVEVMVTLLLAAAGLWSLYATNLLGPTRTHIFDQAAILVQPLTSKFA
ncbi:putative dimethylaniline monooxygenase [Myriangium duriaei CBS 260.36]|uniref:Dimethylaniline monooxygenase n=1 Tax=Myriangium duriaei CBS 260.36 TaxID=1168546 RepID=A0A9P4MH54_9PEZI|nr:putative dimethylaniline monooxygenase [Myriangium duriaei CBS 260.36]